MIAVLLIAGVGRRLSNDKPKVLLDVGGKTLLDLAADDFTDPRSLAEAKQLMRALIAHYTGGKGLETRKIFMELQEL